MLADPYRHAVVVDWKESGDEILGHLRQRFGENDALHSPDLDALIANYEPEPGPRTHQALGQELTTAGLRLYQLPVDSDELILVVVPASAEKKFLSAARSLPEKPTLLVQPAQAPGEPARRLVPPRGDQPRIGVPAGEVLLVPPDVLLVSTTDATTLDTRTWPPVSQSSSFGARLWRYQARPDGVCHAAILEGGDEGPNRLMVLIGSSHDAHPRWEFIDVPPAADEILQPISRRAPDYVARLAFHQDDLLVFRDGALWVVDDLLGGNRRLRFVEDLGRQRRLQRPIAAHSADGRCWMIVNDRVFEYRDHELHPTGVFLVQEGKRTAPTARGFVYTYDAYPGWAEYDVSSGRVRNRTSSLLADRFLTVQVLTGGWIALIRIRDADRDHDLAHLWHPESDTWRRIPFGEFGDVTVTDLLISGSGELWVRGRTGGERTPGTLVNGGRFDDFLRSLDEVPDLQEEKWWAHEPTEELSYPRLVGSRPPRS